jgi:hypothetical protein
LEAAASENVGELLNSGIEGIKAICKQYRAVCIVGEDLNRWEERSSEENEENNPMRLRLMTVALGGISAKRVTLFKLRATNRML